MSTRSCAQQSSDDAILFIYGVARSGTTYLAGLVQRAFDIGMGPEGKFIASLYRKRRSFGDLTKENNLEKFLSAISKSEAFNIIRYRYPEHQRFDVTPLELKKRLSEQSFSGGIEAALRCLAEFQGNSRLGSKNPEFGAQLEILESLFPGRCKYLFLIRDPRDVFLSQNNVPWGKMSAYAFGKHWSKYITRTLEFQTRIGTDRFLTLRYEDLLTDIESSLSRIATFIGDEPCSGNLADAANVERDLVMSNNLDKWKNELSPNDGSVIGALCHEQLKRYGYTIDGHYPPVGPMQSLSFEIKEFSRLIKLNIYHLMRTLPTDWKRTQ